MMKENNNKSRAAFLKKASLALVSIFGLGYAGLKGKASGNQYIDNHPTLSDSDAHDLIRNMQSPGNRQIKPEPPPKRGE